MATKDVEISVGLDGVGRVNASLTRMSAAFSRVGSRFSRVGAGLSRDMGRITSLASGFGRVAGGISFVGLAGAAGVIGGVTVALRGARDVAVETATEIDRLTKLAASTSTRDALTIGGLEFAAGQSGATESQIAGAIRAVNARIVSAVNSESNAAFAQLGLEWGDILRDGTNQARDADQVLVAVADAFSRLPDDVNRAALAAQIFGEEAGPALVTLLNQGGDAIRDYIEEYQELTGIRPGDSDIAAEYQDQADRTRRAFFGLRLAFSREYLPALTEASTALQEFATRNRAQIGAIGTAFADFLSGVAPRLLEVAQTAVDLLSGNVVEDTPISRALVRIFDALAAVRDGVIDVLEFLTTGQTDAPWLQSTIAFAQQAFENIRALIDMIGRFVGFVQEDVTPAVTAAFETISGFLSMLGIDEGPAQFGVIAGLVLFSNTLLSVIGLIGKTVGGLVRLGAAAASATSAASAGAAGAGAAIGTGARVAAGATAAVATVGVGLALDSVSAASLADDTAEAMQVAQLISEQEGDLAGARFIDAWLQEVESRQSGVQRVADRFASFFTGKTVGDLRNQNNEIIARESRAAAAAGEYQSAQTPIVLTFPDGSQVSAAATPDQAGALVDAYRRYARSQQ